MALLNANANALIFVSHKKLDMGKPKVVDMNQGKYANNCCKLVRADVRGKNDGSKRFDLIVEHPIGSGKTMELFACAKQLIRDGGDLITTPSRTQLYFLDVKGKTYSAQKYKWYTTEVFNGKMQLVMPNNLCIVGKATVTAHDTHDSDNSSDESNSTSDDDDDEQEEELDIVKEHKQQKQKEGSVKYTSTCKRCTTLHA